MKIYFSAAIFYKNERGDVYERIAKKLESMGHEVLSYGVTNSEISTIADQTSEELSEHYKTVLKWINRADLVVIEASFPSTIHIGHEITLALEKNTATVVLYEKGKEPFFLNGLNSEKLLLVEYTRKDLEQVLAGGIDYAKDQQDTRFNFFISPRHQNYLDWISKTKKIPRSVYLRNLIETDMKKEEDYN